MKHRVVAQFACGVFMLSATAACVKATEPQAKQSNQKLTSVGDHLRFAGENVQLNTHSDGRHVFVTGDPGNEELINIIVDTGAGTNVIDRTLAEKMGLQTIGEMEVLSGGVEPVTADIVIVPHLRVGGLSIENAEFITLELDAMSLGQFQAVLGMGLFRDALLTFDPQNERIIVSRAELSAGEPGVITYQSIGSGFQIEITAAEQQIMMHLDTGAPSGFTFPLALSQSLPLQGELRAGPVAKLVGGERSIQLGVLDGVVQMGDLIYENPQVAFIDPSPPYGNIGNAIFGDLVLSIDQRNGLLALRRADTVETPQIAAAENTGKPRRLGIQFRGLGGGPLTVSWVEPGSLGERAGIKAGDILTALNGRLAQKYDMKALGALFASSTPLHIEVERDRERRIIEIP